MDKEIKALVQNTNHITVNHRDYDDALETVEACKGCRKEFDHDSNTRKCLAYTNPAAKWPKEGEKFKMGLFTVREPNEKARKMELVEKELPVTPKLCPLASHASLPQIVKTTTKVRAGQGKTSQGGNL